MFLKARACLVYGTDRTLRHITMCHGCAPFEEPPRVWMPGQAEERKITTFSRLRCGNSRLWRFLPSSTALFINNQRESNKKTLPFKQHIQFSTDKIENSVCLYNRPSLAMLW